MKVEGNVLELGCNIRQEQRLELTYAKALGSTGADRAEVRPPGLMMCDCAPEVGLPT